VHGHGRVQTTTPICWRGHGLRAGAWTTTTGGHGPMATPADGPSGMVRHQTSFALTTSHTEHGGRSVGEDQTVTSLFTFTSKLVPTTQRTTKFKCGHTVDWTFDCLIDVEAQKWRWGPRRYSRSQQFGAKRTTRSVPHHRPFQLWRHQAAGRGVRLIGYVVQRTIAVPVLMACPVQSRPVLIWQSQNLFLMRLTELLIWMHVCSNRLTVNFNFNDIVTVLFCYVRGTMRMVPGERWSLFPKCAEQKSTRVYFNTLFLCEDTGNAKTLCHVTDKDVYT